MKIGDFARLGQVSVRMLRHYESLGLLAPETVDRFNGHRSYSVAQLPRLNRIMALNSLGIELKKIAAMLDSDLSTAALVDMLCLRRHQLRADQETTAAKLADVEFRLALIGRTTMEHRDVIIKELPAERILGRTVNLGEPPFDTSEIGPLFGAVADEIVGAGGDPNIGVALYSDAESGTEVTCGYRTNTASDDGTRPDDSASEVLVITELAPCSAATLIHKGAMSRVAASWQHLSEWCIVQGYSLSGPCREIYLEAGDGTDDSDQSEWIVELQQPITV